MTRRTELMLLIGLVAGVLSGCDPAPSTQLAPDKPLPDLSSLPKAEQDRLLKMNQDAGKR